MWGIVACFGIAGMALLLAYFVTADKATKGQRRNATQTDRSTSVDPNSTLVPIPKDPGKNADAGLLSPLGPDTKDNEQPAPPSVRTDPMTTVYTGKMADPVTFKPMPIQAVLTTRRRDATYQALVRYDPATVLSVEVPGLQDIDQALAMEGKRLPSEIRRIDQETEMFVDNLGQPLHSIMTYSAFVNVDGKVVAYELAQSSGGTPERMVGHLTRKGVVVDIFRGNQHVDTNEVTFPNGKTFIPVEMELIPQWFQTHPEQAERKEPVLFSLFMPEVMGFILLKAKPVEEQVIPIADANYECSRFEVWTRSLQASEGQQAHQVMWFDKRTGVLRRIEDIDPTLKPGEGPITERTDVKGLARLSQSTEPVAQLKPHPFPYPLNRPMQYFVNIKDQEIGRIRLKFEPAKTGGDAGFTGTAVVDIGAAGMKRHETSTTQFNANWEVIGYSANGQESGESATDYTVDASLRGEKLSVTQHRRTVPPKSAVSAATRNSADDEIDKTLWPTGKDPLTRIPVSDEDVKSADEPDLKPTTMDQHIDRPLTKGSFVYDHNRLEQLAAMACRLPLPEIKAGESPLLYQKAAMYFVRQNRAGILLFEIGPEPKPALTERQKARQTDSDEPQLFVASASSAMMPCRLLLAPDGKILELSLKLGPNEVTYTLDDPIMRRRAERAKREKLKLGPRLLRPDWW